MGWLAERHMVSSIVSGCYGANEFAVAFDPYINEAMILPYIWHFFTSEIQKHRVLYIIQHVFIHMSKSNLSDISFSLVKDEGKITFYL